MAILAILSAVVVPTLWAFASGRRAGDAAVTIVALSNYARSQAVSEGTVYRLNFDPAAAQVWLTVQQDGAFVAPADEHAQRFDLPPGVRLSVEVTPAAVAVPIARPDVTQELAASPPPFGTAVATPNTLVQVPHDGGGTYVQFAPSGRTDPCLVRLTDAQGYVVTLGCGTATDVIHVLKPGEQ